MWVPHHPEPCKRPGRGAEHPDRLGRSPGLCRRERQRGRGGCGLCPCQHWASPRVRESLPVQPAPPSPRTVLSHAQRAAGAGHALAGSSCLQLVEARCSGPARGVSETPVKPWALAKQSSRLHQGSTGCLNPELVWGGTRGARSLCLPRNLSGADPSPQALQAGTCILDRVQLAKGRAQRRGLSSPKPAALQRCCLGWVVTPNAPPTCADGPELGTGEEGEASELQNRHLRSRSDAPRSPSCL